MVNNGSQTCTGAGAKYPAYKCTGKTVTTINDGAGSSTGTRTYKGTFSFGAPATLLLLHGLLIHSWRHRRAVSRLTVCSILRCSRPAHRLTARSGRNVGDRWLGIDRLGKGVLISGDLIHGVYHLLFSNDDVHRVNSVLLSG